MGIRCEFIYFCLFFTFKNSIDKKYSIRVGMKDEIMRARLP